MPRILVVDDEEKICKLLKGFLEKMGHRVSTASSGKEAIDLVCREAPDAVLLDIRMPGMDGITALNKIREIDEELPIVMVTAVDDTDTAVSAMKMGAYDYLTKPVDLLQLELRIRRALEKGRLVEELREYREGLELKVEERTAELERALRDVKEAHLDTIFRLSLAAEYRDKETAEHLKRMKEFSSIISLTMGLKEEAETIGVASIMHDIGKIGVPEHILFKPGVLSEEEFNIIKNHPIIGAEIMGGSDSELLKIAEAIALSHHEKYDGSGYPHRLKGEDIPLFGRIVAVADVFDALTSRRVYKRAFPNEVAYRMLREGAGKHFDPMVVEAFFTNLESIERAQVNGGNGRAQK